ncbi:hypothetical protein [Pseudorhodobacter sp. MZDSW-24AT]|uniref:hypothetical protein n=1 Tax=Pseudorhodobacter sp. MZDSW-24AT TaxID=2052957 RepID=UPI000C1E0397|nr:hypothetical protein [Pseudorhodobacter sp. MZDSW-24AT]PJF08831.1 hypothetical protein CUR21_10095 [Pseudorhodobacter sp. MZDSW-24AT]
MFEGFIAWLTEANGRLSFFVVPVEKADEGFPWTEAIAAGLATIGSAVVALLVLYLTIRVENKRRHDDELKAEAAGAMNAYSKISRYANNILAVKNAIDQQYADIRREGDELENPSQVVGPIPGRFVEPERLKPDEFRFLLTKENFLIVGEIEDLEASCVLMMSLVEEYSKMHLDTQKWLDDMPHADRKIEGMIASDMIPTAMKGRLDRRVAQMNILIVNVIRIAEQQDPSPKQVMEHFIAAAVASPFGKYFPKMELA